jgi:hypothetical protein
MVGGGLPRGPTGFMDMKKKKSTGVINIYTSVGILAQ